MSAKMYGLLFDTLAKGDADLSADTLKLMLVTSSYTPNIDTHQHLSDVTGEASGTGYTAGGETITNTATTYSSTKHGLVLDGDDVEWADSSITARYAIVYDATATNQPLICVEDFGEDKSSSDGPFKVSFDADGILVLTANPT